MASQNKGYQLLSNEGMELCAKFARAEFERRFSGREIQDNVDELNKLNDIIRKNKESNLSMRHLWDMGDKQ